MPIFKISNSINIKFTQSEQVNKGVYKPPLKSPVENILSTFQETRILGTVHAGFKHLKVIKSKYASLKAGRRRR